MSRPTQHPQPGQGRGHLSGFAPGVPLDRLEWSSPRGRGRDRRPPLKEAFHSDLDPRWVTAAGASTAAVLSRLSEDIISTVASADGSQRRAKGIHLGRASVCRLLRRRALSAAVLASDAGPPLTFAHVAVLAQESGAHVALLSCGSSHLGQQFGLLRASAIGLEAAHFPESHPFVQLIKRTARPAQPLPWLDEARAAVATKSKPE